MCNRGGYILSCGLNFINKRATERSKYEFEHNPNYNTYTAFEFQKYRLELIKII